MHACCSQCVSELMLYLLVHISTIKLYIIVNFASIHIICRLFLVCPKANVMLSSEVCNKTTVVNFASTSVGLQDQLLSLLIKLVS